MSEGQSNGRGKWLVALMVALPIAWFLAWYIAWFDHDDCLGALKQIGASDDALYHSTQVGCDGAARVRNAVEAYGLGALIIGELILLRIVRRR
jgi:hypothetical protein